MEKFTSGKHEIILKRIRDIPSLPEVVNKIIRLLGEPQTPASKIAQLIAYDPGLSAKVLRMVNSAAYGFQRQISSIQHGIMILGFNTVRGLVLSASILKMFEGRGGTQGLDHYAFWRHSLATAMAARRLGGRFGIADTDDAFSAGMLHDIGKIVLDVYFRQDYADVLQAARQRRISTHGPAFTRLEEDVLGTTHSAVGHFLAEKWRLPAAIAEVIECHHRPSEAEHSQPLVHLVALANQLAVVLLEEHGIYNPDRFSRDVLEYFELEDEELPAFIDLLREDMADVDDLLASITQASGF